MVARDVSETPSDPDNPEDAGERNRDYRETRNQGARTTAAPRSKQIRVDELQERQERPRAREMPYINVPSIDTSRYRRLGTDKEEPLPNMERKGPAYKTKAPIEEISDIAGLVDEILDFKLDIPLGSILAVSPLMREEIKKKITKRRIPTNNDDTRGVNVTEEYEESTRNVRFNDTAEVRYQEYGPEDESDIYIEELPPATFHVANISTHEFKKGAIIVGDPVLQYYETLKDKELPKTIFVARQAHALRSVYPRINNGEPLEALLDGGSQIVSMSNETANNRGLMWDPDITINLQSANGQVDKTLGLARNVPFTFDEITLYLQVHIVRNAAYSILLGRPFDALAESEIKNTKDGGQTITIIDPNTGKRCTIPTTKRGQGTQTISAEKLSSFRESMI